MWRHTFPDYQLISRQISNQLARGHKTIGSQPRHLNDERAVNAILYYFNCFCNKNYKKTGVNLHIHSIVTLQGHYWKGET